MISPLVSGRAQASAIRVAQGIFLLWLCTLCLQHPRCWVDTIFSSSHTTNGVLLHDCPKEAVMIIFLLHLIIFNWEQLMIAMHIIHIFKTIYLHVAEAISSTLGG